MVELVLPAREPLAGLVVQQAVAQQTSLVVLAQAMGRIVVVVVVQVELLFRAVLAVLIPLVQVQLMVAVVVQGLRHLEPWQRRVVVALGEKAVQFVVPHQQIGM
jgi:hypothetical protein